MKWIVKRKYERPCSWTRQEFGTEEERAAWLKDNAWEILEGTWLTKEADDEIELFTTEEAKEKAVEIVLMHLKRRIEDQERTIAYTKDFLNAEISKENPEGTTLERYGREIKETQDAIKILKEELEMVEFIRDYEG